MHRYVHTYLHNCSADIVKQKKEVLERQQKTLEEISQRVPEVGHLHSQLKVVEATSLYLFIWASDYT